MEPSTDEYAPFALTDIQRAYLFGRGDGYELGGVSTHAYVEYEGDLDPDRLRAALDAVVARHGMLRVVVDADTGTQRILADPGPVPVEEHDLRGLSATERAAALADVRERMSHAVRPSGAWPLFGVALSRLDEATVRLHVDFDGLALDLTSWRLILADLDAHYRDPGSAPPPPALSYRDYLEALAREPDPGRERARAYWDERLPDLPPPPRPPLVRAPADLDRTRFTAREHLLAPEHWGRLRPLAAGHGVMPVGLCAGALAEVLSRYCGSTRFTLNVPCSHRSAAVHPDAGRVVGQFASFVPVAVDWTAPSFAERVRALQRRVWRDVGHRSAAGVPLLRRLADLRGAGGTAPLPVVFTSGLGEPFPDEPLPGCRQVHAASQTPQVYFDAQVTERGAALAINWDTVDDLLGASAVDALFAEHTALLERLTDPGAWTRPTSPADTAVTGHAPRVLPRTALEEVLCRAWEEALGVSGMGVLDDLRALGAGPAAALAVRESLGEWLPGCPVGRRDLLAATNVAGLADDLAAADVPGRLEEVARLSRRLLDATEVDLAELLTSGGGR